MAIPFLWLYMSIYGDIIYPLVKIQTMENFLEFPLFMGKSTISTQ